MTQRIEIWKGTRTLWQWCVLTWLGFIVVSVHAGEVAEIFNLPSFSLVLNVDKSENALIVFQDRLNKVVQLHLTEFFREKVDATSVGEREVEEEVALSSAYVWRELATSDNGNQQHYEVRSNFDCQIEVGYSTTTNVGNSRLSQSIMDLYLIEAFQGDNYWSLVHSFLKDQVLEDITEVKITVMADGYIHYNGQDPSTLDLYDTTGEWTPAMTAGVVFATLLVMSLVIMWSYICCYTRNSPLARFTMFRRHRFSDKTDSATDDMNSTSTLNPEDDEEEGKWMDQWAESVTSIPLREPVKPRKSKKQRVVRRPGHQHNTFLNSIEEAEDECSTVCSVESSRSKPRERQRATTPTQETILELTEDETVPNDPTLESHVTTNEGLEEANSILYSARSDTLFDVNTSRPQLESITEIM